MRCGLRQRPGWRKCSAATATATATSPHPASWIRAATGANFPAYDCSPTDTADNRALWGENAPLAKKWLDAAAASDGALAKDGEFNFLQLEAIMYDTSSVGVVRAALTGRALSFISAAHKYKADHPLTDAGVSNIVLGAFFLVAPRPMRDVKKAGDLFETAVGIEGNARNRYLAGVGAWARKDWAAARGHFEEAAVAEATSDPQRDVHDFVRAQATKGAAAAASKMG